MNFLVTVLIILGRLNVFILPVVLLVNAFILFRLFVLLVDGLHGFRTYRLVNLPFCIPLNSLLAPLDRPSHRVVRLH